MNQIVDLNKKVEAKEQECEAYKMEAEEGKEINAELKAENEELKKLLKVRIEDLCDSCGASSMKLMPCKVYEKTLTEIKEIIYFNKANRMAGGACISIEQILQKISECEVER